MKTTVAVGVVTYSFLSGLLACLVSISIKLAFNLDLILLFDEKNNLDWYIKLALQIVFICISFLLNSLMWLFYTKSLHLSTNTLYSTALNKFSNFITSVLFGYILFNERINLIRWLFGLFILLIGILLLNDQQEKTKKQ
jgi:drug/metabolite transporter (DMT)-like permease